MIKSNKGTVEVCGNGAVIATDLECIIHALISEDVFSEEVMKLLRKIVGEMEE